MARVFSLVLVFFLAARADAQPSASGWEIYRNAKYGLTLRYPDELLRLERSTPQGDGDLYVARAGNAKLLIGALRNTDRTSPAAYRKMIEARSYAGFETTYRKSGEGWFVISGLGKGQIFYEKVMFSCGGALINSFALVYDVSQRATFDRVVEGIERSFRPDPRICDRVILSGTYFDPN